MSVEVLVGVDVGTTSIKALAVSPGGNVLGAASVVTPWHRDGPLADISPRALADAALSVCADAAGGAQSAVGGAVRVMGIGVTGIAETGVLLDRRGRPCAPALAWFDPRGEVQAIRDAVDRAEFQRSTGMRLNSKPSVSKVLWLQRNIPAASAAVRHLCVGEWIVRALGGDEVTESSLASRTGMFDVSDRAAWGPATELVGDLMPARHVWAGDNAGAAGGDVPDILKGAALTVAGHDHQTASFISGASRDGALFDSMGTAEALIRTVAEPVPREQIERLTDSDISVGWTVIPDHQMLLAGRLTGLSLERIAALLGATGRADRRALGEAALAIVRDPQSPRLVDVGNDSLSIVGVTDGISPALAWRVAVEDLNAIVDDTLRAMEASVGPHLSAVVAGGWIRNPMVAAEKRRQLGDYRIAELDEPGAMGAAFLAGVAAGLLARPGFDGIPAWRS
jgi:sugar (pentulose or hexulose) kinase